MSYQDILIDSRDRNSGSSENFKLNLPFSLTNVKTIELLSVMIPNTLYNITSANNKFKFSENGTTFNDTFNAGSYDINTLVSEIQLTLNALGTNTYTVSFDSTTLKLKIARATGTLPFSIVVASDTFTDLLGFPATTAEDNANKTGSNIVQLNNFYSIGILVNQFNNKIRTSSNKNFSFVVNANVNSGSIISDLEECVLTTEPSQQSFQQLDVQLDFTYKNSSAFSLNGANWQMLLRFHYDC